MELEAAGNAVDDICLNCGTRLDGAYCGSCGQQAHVHRTLSAIWHDIAHGVFHFEGKIWRTLPMLAWRPGDLTRRYVHGERARFLSPLALFLFCVFLMFAVFETVGGPVIVGGVRDRQALAAASEAKIAELEATRRTASTGSVPAAKLDAQIADEKGNLASLRFFDGKPVVLNGENVKIDLGSPELDARVRKGLENPNLLLYKLQSSAYKFAWALIPMSLPFMWLMFAWRRRYHMYDHAVFVTYSLSFTMLLLIGMSLLNALGAVSAGQWLIWLLPVHFFVQLKGAYALTKRGALWRTVILVGVASTVLLTFALALLALGLAG